MDLWDLSVKSFNGRIIFHIHSTYTDGESTITEYCDFFRETGEILVFTEHIRKTPNYNYSEFIKEVHKQGQLAGFEAKLLPGGKLDIPGDALEKADLLAVAVHSLELDCLDDLIHGLKRVFSNYSLKLPLVWVHPVSSKIEKSLITEKMAYLKEVLSDFRSVVGVEHNLRHALFKEDEIDFIAKNNPVIKGYDAHSLKDLLYMRELEKEKKTIGDIATKD